MEAQTQYLNDYIQKIHKDNSQQRIVLLGHSFGARIIMSTLQKYNEQLQNKINGTLIVDLLPNYLPNSSQMNEILNKICTVQLQNQTEQQIIAQIQNIVDEKHMQNLFISHINFKQQIWNINIEDIARNYIKNISQQINGNWQGKVKILVGEKSDYVPKDKIQNYKDIFQNIDLNNDIKQIPKAGHWIQVDNPNVFIQEVNNFLKEIQ